MIRKRREIVVSSLRTESRGGVHRASADVDGIPLWFESGDTELFAAPEAFGSALLLASQHRGRRLVIENPVDRTWAENVARLVEIWKTWWGYKVLSPVIETRGGSERVHASATSLCFSGGVDSFYSLITGPCPDFLVAVHGFDISIPDTARMAGLHRTVTAAAKSVGARPIVIRTNLREHPSGGRPYLWERSHGAALATIGHVLGPKIDQHSISAAYSLNFAKPWGSHRDTDPLFSSSDLRIVHVGIALREEKVRSILTHPMARDHLRVCWENRKPEGNCSRCGKCLLTMIHLAEYGVLDEFTVFEGADQLSERLDAVPYMKTHIPVLERAVRRGRLDPPVSESANRLVMRSLRAAPWHAWRTRVRSLADRYV